MVAHLDHDQVVRRYSLPTPLVEELRALAVREGVTINDLMARAVQLYHDKRRDAVRKNSKF